MERIAAKRAELEELELLAQSETKNPAKKEQVSSLEDNSDDERKYQRGGRKLRTTVHPESTISTTLREGSAVDFDHNASPSHDAIFRTSKEDEDLITGVEEFSIKSCGDIETESAPSSTRALPPKDCQITTCISCGSKRAAEQSPQHVLQNDAARPASNEPSNQEHPGFGQGSKKAKPFSIRLDLNLELEILLRAKIKGEVTITFL